MDKAPEKQARKLQDAQADDEVWNYDPVTRLLTRVKSRDASASKNNPLKRSQELKMLSHLTEDIETLIKLFLAMGPGNFAISEWLLKKLIHMVFTWDRFWTYIWSPSGEKLEL